MSKIRVAMLGLSWNHPMVPEHLQPLVHKTLATVETRMTEAGFQYKFVLVSPKEGVAGLGEKLHSLDLVVIGNVIRSNIALTPFLEKISIALQASAPQARLAFNTLPENSVEAVCPDAPPA